MDRLRELRRFITMEGKGLEIAPWFIPIAPRGAGYRCASLDILDREQLIARAVADPNIPKEKLALIETVDFLGNAVEIAEIIGETDELGSFDYILSSHNFEHLPNPIRFLQGCQKVLKPDGVLSMAIPDMRATYDHFRPRTVIGDWLEAYFENRVRPTPAQIFAQISLSGKLAEPPGRETAYLLEDDPAMIFPDEYLDSGLAAWREMLEGRGAHYTDAHCSVGTITSFQLLISECWFLGLIDFAVREASGLNGCEFFLHLEKRQRPADETAFKAEFYKQRSALFHAIENELAQSSPWGWAQRQIQVNHDQPSRDRR